MPEDGRQELPESENPKPNNGRDNAACMNMALDHGYRANGPAKLADDHHNAQQSERRR
jgi:hypothetical protein